jgi:hypothetical protein
MTTPSYDDIRQQIERRYRRLSWFVFHVIMAVMTVAVIWMIDPTPQDGSPVIAALWCGVLIFQAIKIWMDTVRDREIERTWQHISGENVAEKPKRSRIQDAELEVVEDEPIRLGDHLKNQSRNHSAQG